MQQKLLYYLTFLTLIILLALTSYKYFQSKKREKELSILLEKSAYSVDRDNSYIHDDLKLILNNEYLAKGRPYLPLQKKIFDSLVSSLKTSDSNQLKSTLIKSVIDKLNLNDSLIHFRSNWTHHGTPNYSYSMVEYFEHAPIFKYGDTINFTFHVISTIGLIKPEYQIIDFFPKNFCKNGKWYLKLSIPTRSLVNSPQNPVEHTIEYKYLLKNIYTNKVDTLFLTREVTITP